MEERLNFFAAEVAKIFGVSTETIDAFCKNYERETSDRFKLTLSEMSKEEVETLLDSVASYVHGAPPVIRRMHGMTVQALINLVRGVKTTSNVAEFKGFHASGNELTIEPICADMFTTVWGQTGKTDFETTLTSTGWTDYIGTETDQESTDEDTGYVIIGFMDTAAVPKVNKVYISKNKEPYQWVGLPFKLCGQKQVVQLPQPILVFPESNFYLKMFAYITGNTDTIPIGYQVTRAKNVTQL